VIVDEIEMPDIVKRGSIGPFAVGRILNEIGDGIGTPDYWGFPPGREMNFYVGYGPLEVYIRADRNAGVLNFIKLKTFKFKRSAFIFRNVYKGEALRVTVTNTWRTYEGAKSALKRISVKFSTEFQEPVKADTSAVINIENSTRLYFRRHGEDNILDAVEFS